ncbi:MAG TPA: energy transducer TonB [Candidatus Binatia bacterium]|nr:energy transducer TonB [Candidatus Binatia bacterium]
MNTSSGSEALDRAAAEAIKRWRFHPARYGDKAVESWLRIPIEFRLADAQTR